MNILPDDITFERWVDHVFDHPCLDPQWWFHDDGSEYHEYWNEDANPARTLDYLTRLFNSPAFLISRYSRSQIDQGLNYLVSSSSSNHMDVLTNLELPWPQRGRCITAMSTLYAQLMAPVYGNTLGHADDRRDPTFSNFSCYMWWDLMPIYGAMNHADQQAINDRVLGVFRTTLDLRAESCLESVLHGLGHWHDDLPDACGQIVEQFLRRRNDISDELRMYAQNAASGMVN